MKRLSLCLDHAQIVLALVFLVIEILDWYNPYMGFRDLGVSAALMLAFCLTALARAVPAVFQAGQAGRRLHPPPSRAGRDDRRLSAGPRAPGPARHDRCNRMEMFYAQSLVLGVVEGCTEFLPVSSTGHLIVFEALLGFQGRTRYVETYSYVIQLGAVLAVAVLYRRQIGASLQAFWPRGGLQPRPWAETGLYFWLSLALACLPGLLATLLLGSLADAFFSQPGWVALALILGGAALCLAERFWARPAAARQALPWPRVSMGQALTVGAFQCLAVLPGVSRSASTIIGGWFAGLDTTASAAFSFFLAMPVMAGMSALKLIQLGGFAAMDPVELTGLGIGFAVSFLTALLVVKRFTAYIAKQGMVLFGVYRTVFGFLILAALASGSLAPAA